MKKIIPNLIFSIFLLIIISFLVSAMENCTSYDYLSCYNSNSYWFDSCGNPEYVNQYCNSNQECVNGECVNLCGNDICNSDKGEDCSNCLNDCPCQRYENCEWGKCKIYCGNGRCDSEENCWKCNSDCPCANDQKCEYPGVCKTYCGNGKCDSEENCQTCKDCICNSNEECTPGSQKADSRGCVNRCGNSIIDGGENCQTCPADAGCSEGSYCFNNECVECFKDIHCESRETSTGEFTCAPDFRSVLEKIIVSQGICQNNQCTGEKVETTKTSKVCENKLCQDGECGCKEGFAACIKSGKCEKQSILEDGQSCLCYFQCSSNYCNPQGKCVKAINAPLTVSSKFLKVGETTKVSISADNALEEDVQTKITLNTDSGVIMSGIIGGADCSGNQCTGGQILIPSKDRMAILIDLTAQSYGKYTLKATITPTIDGQQYPKEEKVEITIINPGDGVCSEGETSQNACSDCKCPEPTSLYDYICKDNQSCKKIIKWQIYIIFIIIAGLIALSIYSVPRTRDYLRKISEQREKKKDEKDEKEAVERKKIANALYSIKKDIDFNNPMPVEKVIEKAKLKDADPELVDEEYIQLLERTKKVKEISGKKEEVQKEPLSQRFCTGCGAQLRPDAKFCTKCGRHIKK